MQYKSTEKKAVADITFHNTNYSILMVTPIYAFNEVT
jgi:hypothetical protein